MGDGSSDERRLVSTPSENIAVVEFLQPMHWCADISRVSFYPHSSLMHVVCAVSLETMSFVLNFPVTCLHPNLAPFSKLIPILTSQFLI